MSTSVSAAANPAASASTAPEAAAVPANLPSASMDPALRDDPEQLLPIAILMDELKHDDIATRLAALRKIRLIALALGPDRSRAELVPFLQEFTDEEDELLLVLASELGPPFAELLGGPTHAHLLLSVLEALACTEETVVREKAVESICMLAALFSKSQLEEHLLPLVRRLCAAQWFTAKCSACFLHRVLYAALAPDLQAELRKSFATLSHDEAPMVRRAASKALPVRELLN